MNDLLMTVAGWVATEPRHVVGPTGTRLTSFRLASTSRHFDREKNEWVDGRTEWFTVRTFRSAAITVTNSIEKGQPVTVYGRFRTNEWESESGVRTDLILDAITIGHDLTRGVATFTRATGDASLASASEQPSELEDLSGSEGLVPEVSEAAESGLDDSAVVNSAVVNSAVVELEPAGV